jgi:hypothetical protein
MDNNESFSGKYDLNQSLIDLIINLADVHEGSNVLVIESGSQIVAPLLYEKGCVVVPVDNSEHEKDQIKGVIEHKPYDAAIVIPHFSNKRAPLPNPNGWELSTNSYIEDYLIAYVTDSLRENGDLRPKM